MDAMEAVRCSECKQAMIEVLITDHRRRPYGFTRLQESQWFCINPYCALCQMSNPCEPTQNIEARAY